MYASSLLVNSLGWERLRQAMLAHLELLCTCDFSVVRYPIDLNDDSTKMDIVEITLGGLQVAMIPCHNDRGEEVIYFAAHKGGPIQDGQHRLGLN
jgi:hypothetical protein